MSRSVNIFLLFAIVFFSQFSFAGLPTYEHMGCVAPANVSAVLASCPANYTCAQGEQGPATCSAGSVELYKFVTTQCNGTHEVVGGQCVEKCTVAGQTRNSSGQCECPNGGAPDQTLEDVIADIPAQCRTPTEKCGYRKSQTPSFSEINLKSAVAGCRTNCELNASGPWPVSCTYTGEPYDFGTGDGNANVPGTPTFEPPAETQPSNDTCPAGTDPGYVNGQRYCAPRTKSNGEPNQSPSMGNNPQASTETTRETTTTNSDGSVTNTKTTTTTHSNGTVTTTTTTTTTHPDGSVDTSVTGGSIGPGNGSGSGEGDGAGECDPTDDNYFQCLQVLEEKPDSNSEQGMLDAAGNKVDTQLDSIEQQQNDAINSAGDFEIDTPDNLVNAVQGVLPNGSSCSAYTFQFPRHPVTIPCDKLADFKEFLAWALAIGTIIYIAKLSTKPVGD